MPDLPRSYPFAFSPSARPLPRLLGAGSLADRLNHHPPVPAEHAVRPPAAPTEERA